HAHLLNLVDAKPLGEARPVHRVAYLVDRLRPVRHRELHDRRETRRHELEELHRASLSKALIDALGAHDVDADFDVIERNRLREVEGRILLLREFVADEVSALREAKIEPSLLAQGDPRAPVPDVESARPDAIDDALSESLLEP